MDRSLCQALGTLGFLGTSYCLIPTMPFETGKNYFPCFTDVGTEAYRRKQLSRRPGGVIGGAEI